MHWRLTTHWALCAYMVTVCICREPITSWSVGGNKSMSAPSLSFMILRLVDESQFKYKQLLIGYSLKYCLKYLVLNAIINQWNDTFQIRMLADTLGEFTKVSSVFNSCKNVYRKYWIRFIFGLCRWHLTSSAPGHVRIIAGSLLIVMNRIVIL